MNVILHQFAYSHFNEKVRWTLDFKGIGHHRKTYLPGPHMRSIKKLSGQTQTPVLELDKQIVAGSAAIIDCLETAYPNPPLYPADPSARQQALSIQTNLDIKLGPAVRTALFSGLIHEADYLCDMFAGNKSRFKQVLYRAAFPLARGLMAKGNGVDDPGNIAACMAQTRELLDWLTEQTGATGYLVGDSFCIADLTAAALLAPVAQVDHPDMKRPEPIPAKVKEVLNQFKDHPAIAWARQIYTHHR